MMTCKAHTLVIAACGGWLVGAAFATFTTTAKAQASSEVRQAATDSALVKRSALEELFSNASSTLDTYFETTLDKEGTLGNNRRRFYLENDWSFGWYEDRLTTSATLRFMKSFNRTNQFKPWFHSLSASVALLKDNEHFAINPYLIYDIVPTGSDSWSIGSSASATYSLPTAAGKLKFAGVVDGWAISYAEENRTKVNVPSASSLADADRNRLDLIASDSQPDTLTAVQQDEVYWLDSYAQVTLADVGGIKGLNAYTRARVINVFEPQYNLDGDGAQARVSLDEYTQLERTRLRLKAYYTTADRLTLGASFIQNWNGLFESRIKTGTDATTFFNSPYQVRMSVAYVLL